MKKIKDAVISAVAIIALTSIAIFFISTTSLSNYFRSVKTSSTSIQPAAEFTDSKYKTVSSKPNGWFTTGQEADIMLSGFGFNNAGGPLLFNHPGNIATDGKRLILADRNNNRVLIWNELPANSNEEPDLVLGQKDFITNNPGSGLDEMNWPIGLATDGKYLLVTDVENDRVLIWNEFPTANGEPADLVLGGIKEESIDRRGSIVWPWAAWTDGQKVVVTSTATYQVLIWNSFPTQNNQLPDVTIRLKDKFGTPRSIGSDGKHLAIGDHNAFNTKQGTFFWNEFPTKEDQMYDFFIADPGRIGSTEPIDPWLAQGEVMWGMTFTPDGKFISLTNKLNIWNHFPENDNDAPDLSVGAQHLGAPGYKWDDGDGSGIAFADGRIYVSLYNGNKIVIYDSLPTRQDQVPDKVMGSPDIYTNTLQTEFIISNPVPVTDGKSLFVISDFDGRMYVWKNIPDESGAKPDIVYNDLEAYDNEIFNNMLITAGRTKANIWKTLPLNGEQPDITFEKYIGNVELQDVRGVSMDEKYFYLADYRADKIYVWEGIPEKNSNPKFTLSTTKPIKLYSDGKYLLVTSNEDRPGGSVKIYAIDDMSSDTQPKLLEWEGGRFNGPGHAIVYDGHLFVADCGFHRVVVWNKIEDALLGKKADMILGAKNFEDLEAEIGKDTLFMPYSLAFDGNYLWVGEVKFSERIVRFPVH